MSKAIGMIEYVTVSLGVEATDTMVKAAEVDIIEAQVVCPGKYIAIITGELSAVKAAVEAATAKCPEKVVDKFVLGNPHEAIFPAISSSTATGTSGVRPPASVRFTPLGVEYLPTDRFTTEPSDKVNAIW